MICTAEPAPSPRFWHLCAKEVVGVEIVEEAVEAAKRKCKLEMALINCNFIAGDVLKVLDDIEEKPDMIVLDPPRDGIHPKAIGEDSGLWCGRIWYIFPASRQAWQEILEIL